MSKFLLLLGLLSVPFVASGEGIKKWVDDKGVIHYGDAPPPNAGEVRHVELKGDAVKNFDGPVSRKNNSPNRSSEEGYWICPPAD